MEYSNLYLKASLAETDTLVEEKVEEETTVSHSLTIFNDDYNTFDDVISALVTVCGHNHIQAEQCAYITHFKGKCAVKGGNFDILTPMRDAICLRGISAEIL